MAMSAIGFLLAVMATSAFTEDDVLAERGAFCGVPGWYFDWVGGHHCYLVDPMATGNMTWAEAVEYCATTASAAFPGAHIADVLSQDQNNFLLTIVLALYESGGINTAYWIGGTDLDQEGDWVWAHSGEQVSFEAWYKGEPDGWIDQNCMTFGTNVDEEWNSWHDMGCDVLRPVICKAFFHP